MNQTMQSIRVGIFFILGLALIYAVYSVIGGDSFNGSKGYGIEANFKNIKTLTPGADVRMAGVKIGEVTGTRLKDGQGVVDLQIESSVSIPSDSVATVAMASLLGQNYISVEHGGEASPLAQGDRIETRNSLDINDVVDEVQQLAGRMNSIADNFSSLGGEDMNNLFSNLNSLVLDNRDKIDSITTNLESLTGELAGGEGTLGSLINDDKLYNQLVGAVDEIRNAAQGAGSTLDDARNLISRIDRGEGALGKLLNDPVLASDIESTVHNLKTFTETLNSSDGTLGKLLQDDSIYQELQGILDKANNALDGMEDSGPITAVGSLSGALF